MVPGKVVRRRRVNREDKPEHLVTYFNIKQQTHKQCKSFRQKDMK